MRNVVQVGAIVAVIGGILSSACAGPVVKPRSRQVRVGGLRIAPDAVVSLSVSGPSLARTYVWTQEEAERHKGPKSEELTAHYPNRLLDLYTDDGFLVVKWNRWKSPKRPHDEGSADVHTLINLSRIVYLNVNDRGNGKYHLRIELGKTE